MLLGASCSVVGIADPALTITFSKGFKFSLLLRVCLSFQRAVVCSP